MVDVHIYEIRLSAKDNSSLQFVTVRADDAVAELHARALLARYPEYTKAELWRGMKLLKEVVIGLDQTGQA